MSKALTWPTRSSKTGAERAPGCENTRMPSRKAMIVGIDVISRAPAKACSASVSTLPKTASGCSAEVFSKTGPN
jgi:hypothetical protein